MHGAVDERVTRNGRSSVACVGVPVSPPVVFALLRGHSLSCSKVLLLLLLSLRYIHGRGRGEIGECCPWGGCGRDKTNLYEKMADVTTLESWESWSDLKLSAHPMDVWPNCRGIYVCGAAVHI